MIEVDHDSPVAPYEQIRTQVIELIRNGELAVGARLRTVRRLADDLGLAVNTVARAYRELESAGHVETRGRAGTVVRGRDATTETARRAAQDYTSVARATGMSIDEAIRLLRTAFETGR